MASNQGVRRLKQGIVRPLKPHELDRGYVFISKDKRLGEILDTKDFEVHIAGEVLPRRKLDSQGRIQMPKRLLQNIGATQALHISLVSRNRLKIGIAAGDTRRQDGHATVRA